MLPQEGTIPLPRQRPPTRATTQPFPPYTADTPIKLHDAAVIRRAPVILVMAAEFCIQGLLLFAHRLVPVLFTPVGDRLQPSAEPFCNRSHVDCELALAAAGAQMREPKEVEGCGSLPLLLRIPRCIAPELNQPGLLRVQGQTVFLKPLR